MKKGSSHCNAPTAVTRNASSRSRRLRYPSITPRRSRALRWRPQNASGRSGRIHGRR